MRCTEALDAGSYVLGSLAPAEREAYESHLARCPACRQEVAQLAVLPGLMARLDSPTAEAIAREGDPNAVPTAPVTLLPRVLDAARDRRTRERRVGRWRGIAAGLVAAGLLVAAGIGVHLMDESTGRGSPGAQSGPTGKPGTQASASGLVYQPMHTVVAGPVPITAEVALEAFPGGTHVFMHCAYRAATHDPGRLTLHLMVYPRWGGPAEEISSWNAGDGDDLTPDPLSRLSPMEIRRAELRWETMPVLAIDYP